MLNWLLPALGFLVANGLLGIATKLALRDVGWRSILAWASAWYVLLGVVLLLFGVGFVVDENIEWALAVGVLVPGGLLFFYVALVTGEVSRVIPIGASYPAVTVLAAAAFLDEPLTVTRILGTLLVIVGVVLVSIDIGGRRQKVGVDADAAES